MHYLKSAAAIGALGLGLVTVSAPASAQIGIDVGAPGVGVRTGDSEQRRYDERRRVPGYEDRNAGNCQTVTVRKERDDGTVTTRRERRCD